MAGWEQAAARPGALEFKIEVEGLKDGWAEGAKRHRIKVCAWTCMPCPRPIQPRVAAKAFPKLRLHIDICRVLSHKLDTEHASFNSHDNPLQQCRIANATLLSPVSPSLPFTTALPATSLASPSQIPTPT
jgi:hypothetical protein